MSVNVEGIFAVNDKKLFGTDKPLIFRTTVIRNTKAALNLTKKNFAVAVISLPPAISPGPKGTFSPPSDFTLKVSDPHTDGRYKLTATPVGGLSEGVVWIAGDYELKISAKVKVGSLIKKASGMLAFSITAP